MAQAKIYWDKDDYQQVEKIFRKSVEFCSEHDTWKLNVAHVLFMQVGFSFPGHLGSLGLRPVYILCISLSSSTSLLPFLSVYYHLCWLTPDEADATAAVVRVGWLSFLASKYIKCNTYHRRSGKMIIILATQI